MPWKETDPMKERVKFVLDAASGLYRMTELCQGYGISREKGYKWLNRYRDEGIEGLKDRSRAPEHCPHRTSEAIQEKIIQARKKHPRWGPVTLLHWLRRGEPQVSWPAASTAGTILKREGLIGERKKRRRGPPVKGKAKGDLSEAQPGEVMTIDYKGEFRTGDGLYCYPLTLQEFTSRYLLACQAHLSTALEGARKVCEQVFEKQGLPRIILSDNGTPFAGSSWTGLTQLSLWWLDLGIEHRRIEGGHPEQNGRHERMHRTLKEATCYPPAADAGCQQKVFDLFREEFNQDRPHGALWGQVPAQHFEGLSEPNRPPSRVMDYPGHYERRRVGSNGMIKFKGLELFVSKSLKHRVVGLEEVAFRAWSLYYGPRLLGRFREGERRIYAGQD